ncbi:hypothetical protein Hdeb2414_s0019g00550021 [Helianthus debilis subsp. tardiflorus]
MKFKELFRSFTSHRVENRTTGTRCGSTGAQEVKIGETETESPSPTGPRPSATPSKIARQSNKPVTSKIGRRPRFSY